MGRRAPSARTRASPTHAAPMPSAQRHKLTRPVLSAAACPATRAPTARRRSTTAALVRVRTAPVSTAFWAMTASALTDSRVICASKKLTSVDQRRVKMAAHVFSHTQTCMFVCVPAITKAASVRPRLIRATPIRAETGPRVWQAPTPTNTYASVIQVLILILYHSFDKVV